MKRILTVVSSLICWSGASMAGEMGHYIPGSWSPRDLISAPVGLKVFAPYMSVSHAGANARLTAYDQDILLFENNNSGWDDLSVIPAYLTWHLNEYWALSAQCACRALVGEYDDDRADIVGLAS